jgi:hypothetical protein
MKMLLNRFCVAAGYPIIKRSQQLIRAKPRSRVTPDSRRLPGKEILPVMIGFSSSLVTGELSVIRSARCPIRSLPSTTIEWLWSIAGVQDNMTIITRAKKVMAGMKTRYERFMKN